MTYSEVRSAYELTKSNNREVSSHVLPASISYKLMAISISVTWNTLALSSHLNLLSVMFQVIVGSTHLYTPKEFLHSLAALSS